jgi:hypothetical protein
MKEIGRLQERISRNLWLASLVVCFNFLLSGTSIAQVSMATIRGLVTDSTGATLPGATLVLRNVATSVTSTTVTNRAGAYELLSITPGTYTLEAAAAGFTKEQLPQFTLTVGQAATIDFTLKVGTQNVVVNVEGTSTQLETSSASLGTVIQTEQVNELPLNGRNFTQLLLLTPGASPVNVTQNGGGVNTPVTIGSAFSFPALNGGTNRSNFFLVDGLNDYETIFSTYAVAPVIDAIQEFKVVSHTDDAEFGSVTGGVVNVVTKSGTNSLHGSLWEYDRDQIFDARSYFLPSDVAKTPYHQNQFGGALGGPVWIPKLYNGRNRTFFFGDYQGFRYSQTSNTLLFLPTAAELAGDESAWPTQIYNPFSTRPDPVHPGQFIRDPFPGNQIPANLIDPRMVAYAQFVFPAAGPTQSNGSNGLDTTPVTQTQNEWSVRVDQKIGANDSAFFRYSWVNELTSSSGGLPGVPNTNPVQGRDWGGSYTHVFSPSLALQGQYTRTTLLNNSQTLFSKPTSAIFNEIGFSAGFAGNFTAPGAPGGQLIPNPQISGFSGAGDNIMDQPKTTDSHQFYGSLTKIIGDHTLHVGGGYISAGFTSPISYALFGNLGAPVPGFAAQQTGDTNPNDTINSGDPIASFILNIPNAAERRNVNETERPGGVLSAFVQDTWRASHKLTLNFGLRYDVTLIPPYGTNATIGQQGGIETGDMDFTNGTYLVQKVPPACTVTGKAPCIPGNGTLPEHVFADPRGKIAYNSYDNLGPRVGFSYQVGNNTVVRAAFGIVYDNWAAVNQIAQNIEGSWPDTGEQLIANLNQPTTASPTPTVTAQNPFGASGNSLLPPLTPFSQYGYFYDPHMKDPYSEQWNFGVEHLFGSSRTMKVDYVGAGSHRLDEGYLYNTALTPAPGDVQARALYPYISATPYDRSFGNNGSYNALQVSFDQRLTDGLLYQVAYTWSKMMDVGTDGWFGAEGGNTTDPYNPAAYGNHTVAGFDLTNILSVNLIYQVPVGKGKQFSTGNRVFDYILGNWQVNTIFSAHSGTPFTPYISSDIANTGNSGYYEHLNLVGNPHLAKGNASEWFNTAAYVVPPGYTYGTASRNSLRSPAFWGMDGSVFRQFPIGESRRFEFRAEAFNLLNNVILGTPYSDFNTGPLFGTITSTANSAREIQLVGKFVF